LPERFKLILTFSRKKLNFRSTIEGSLGYPFLQASIDGKAAQRREAVRNPDQVARRRRLGRLSEPGQHGNADVGRRRQQRFDSATPVRSERVRQDAMDQPLGSSTGLVQDQFQHGCRRQQDPPAAQLVDQCGRKRHRIPVHLRYRQ